MPFNSLLQQKYKMNTNKEIKSTYRLKLSDPKKIEINIRVKNHRFLTERSRHYQFEQQTQQKGRTYTQKQGLQKTFGFQLPFLLKRTPEYVQARIMKQSLNRNKKVEKLLKRTLRILEEKYDISIQKDDARVIKSYIIYVKLLFRVVENAKKQIQEQLGKSKKDKQVLLKCGFSEPVFKLNKNQKTINKQILNKSSMAKNSRQQPSSRLGYFSIKNKINKNSLSIPLKKNGLRCITQQNKNNCSQSIDQNDQELKILSNSRMISLTKQNQIQITHYRLYCIQQYFELWKYSPEHIAESVAEKVMNFFLAQKTQRKNNHNRIPTPAYLGLASQVKRSQKNIPSKVQDRTKNRLNVISDESELFDLIAQLGNIIKQQSTEPGRLLQVMSFIRQNLAKTIKRLRCRRGTWIISMEGK